MVLYRAKFCNVKGSDGNIYLAGIQIMLRNPTTFAAYTLPYHGFDSTKFTAAELYTCYLRTLDGPATKWQVGLRTYLTNTVKMVDLIQLGTASGLFYDNAFVIAQVNAGTAQSTVPATQILIGVAGTFTRFIESVDWLSYSTSCTCDSSDFVKPPVRNMYASIANGDYDAVPIPAYKPQFEQFTGTACPPTTLTLSKSDYSSCEAFLTMSGT